MSPAEQKVNLPGIALMVYGLLGVLGALSAMASQAVQAIPAAAMALVEQSSQVELFFLVGSDVFSLLWTMSGAAVSVVIALAGFRLRQLSSPGLVYLGTILAMVPLCSGFTPFIPVPCCCLGLFVGMWVLVTLQDEDVKAALAE